MNLKSNGVKKAERVEPIKSKKDIKKIRAYLKGSNMRNYALFVCGTNFLLRASDLTRIKWSDVVEGNDFKDSFTLTEEKTDKARTVRINVDVKEALKLYKGNIKNFNFNDYIFKSRKGSNPLDVKSIHRIIKETCKDLNIKGNYGSHTLRKTGSYRIYVDNIAENPMIISYLQKILNHGSQSTTLRYIGIEQEEINDIFDNLKWD